MTAQTHSKIIGPACFGQNQSAAGSRLARAHGRASRVDTTPSLCSARLRSKSNVIGGMGAFRGSCGASERSRR